MYQFTHWLDEVDQYEDIFVEETSSVVSGGVKHTKYRGTVQQQGTPQNAENFNKIEQGILDAHIAHALLQQYVREKGWQDDERLDALEKATVQETGTVTLTNSMAFPFNNSKKSVALTNVRDNLNYVIVVVSKVANDGGNIGEIEFSERQVNGFKIEHTGSSKSVTVVYAVIGGYNG